MKTNEINDILNTIKELLEGKEILGVSQLADYEECSNCNEKLYKHIRICFKNPVKESE